MNQLINMNELEKALAIVKNATDILIEEAGYRRGLLNDYYDSTEQQYLFDREQDGDAVELIAFLDVVEIGKFDVRRDMKNIHNRENQIRERIRLKAQSQIGE